MFPLILLFGEVTPKTIAASNPIRISTGVVATPLALWSRLDHAAQICSSPRCRWHNHMDRRGVNGHRKTSFGSMSFVPFWRMLPKKEYLDATERVLIDNLLEAGETEIVEIMTPRTRIEFLEDRHAGA